MVRRGFIKAGTGLAAGALLTALLLGVLLLGYLAGLPLVPFTVFEWLVRVLPGDVVNSGLDVAVRVLDGLGLSSGDTAKAAEQALALTSLFVAGLIAGLLFFVLVRPGDHSRIRRYGLMLGLVAGLFSAVIALFQDDPAGLPGKIGHTLWVLVVFVLWGWGLARLYLATFPAAREVFASAEAPPVTDSAASVNAGIGGPLEVEARAVSRRRFIVQMGGLAATIIVVGAGVSAVLYRQTTSEPPGPGATPGTLPNDDSPVEPAPGTRPEYTPVEDHYRVDIVLAAPEIDEATWRLTVDGLVDTPLSLSLDQLRSDYKALDKYVTMSCISNMLGGPLIGTTLWTGIPLRDVLAQAGPASGARWVHITSADDFDEQVELELVETDPRITLTYAWDREPLPAAHGFPLRVCIPDRYGMKQPKWINRITLTSESIPGYWVRRNWDEKGEIKTVSVIDTVATRSLVARGGQTYIPIGGIAHAGAKGISKVEVQIDDAPWQFAQLREPLSELTWVVWRYDWPFSEGTHWLAVRAYDGQGQLQETAETVSSVGTAVTGLYKEYRTIPPLQP